MKKSAEKKLNAIRTPGPEFRSRPFWAWNGELADQEIRRQIHIMKQMGMGGYFMHSRAGLVTGYLSKAWFDAIAVGIDEAKKLGMKADLYDEDRWPSGACGGLLTKDKRYRMRFLEFVWDNGALPEDSVVLGTFAAKRTADQSDIRCYRKLENGEAPAAGESKLTIYKRIAPSEPGYNNGSYLDTMNPDAVKAFVTMTHQQYAERFQDEFGKTTETIFTDEPNYMDRFRDNVRPWTDRLPEIFEAEYGSSLLPYLPELFFHCNQHFSTVRYRFYRTVSRLFCEAFGGVVGSWCKAHNIGLTGHVLLEDSLCRQIYAVGECMPFYEYMEIPGIDLLTERWMALNTAKQTTSAARQLGKKRVLSESYGATGWDFPLRGHKTLGDWQYLTGINLRCPHLYWYTMRGIGKRDYPASIGEQSPWYPIYGKLEDYFARLAQLIAEGTPRIPLAVLHPIETMWGYAGNHHGVKNFDEKYDKKFDNLPRLLLEHHLDFEYVSEAMLPKFGAVNGRLLQIGKVEYPHLLIPEVETLRSSTVELLKKFAEAGGAVDYLGKVPGYVDGEPDVSGCLARLYANFRPLSEAEFAKQLAAELSTVQCRKADGETERRVLLRSNDLEENLSAVVAVNLGMKLSEDPFFEPWVDMRNDAVNDCRMSMTAPAGRTVYQLDLMKDRLTKVDFTFDGTAYHWPLALAPQESACFVLSAEAMPCDVVPEKTVAADDLRFERTELTEANLLVLDHAEARMAEDAELLTGNILDIDQTIRKKMGLPARGGGELQPWMQATLPPCKPWNISVTFRFQCEAMISGKLELVMERAPELALKLNGKPVKPEFHGYWCDPALECVALDPKDLRIGENELTFDLEYTSDYAGLEDCFLRGEFCVKDENTLAGKKDLLPGVSTTEAGYPFYSGNLRYVYSFETRTDGAVGFAIPEWYGSALAMQLDDKETEYLFAPPDQATFAGVKAGRHQLTVTVFGHRRNAFGPFYMKERTYWYGPYEFMVRETERKQLVKLGLLQNPVNFVK